MKYYKIVGYRQFKYVYEVYCEQLYEFEEQPYVGKRVIVAYSKNEPTIDDVTNPKYYDKTKKYYIFN